MAKYELTFFTNTEEEAKTVQQVVKSVSGKVAEEKAWGKRTLSYPVQKQSFAFYFTLTLDMDQKQAQELKKKLQFNEKLMRYLLLQKGN